MGHSSSNEVPETAQEKALAQVAAERWQSFKDNGIPVENQAIRSIDQMNKSQLLPGLANVDTQMEFSRGQNQLGSNMMNRGMRVGSAGFGLNMADYNTDRASASGLEQAQSYGLRTGQYLNNLGTMIGVGEGKSNAALQGSNSIAQLSQRQAIINSQAAIAARGALGQGIGTAAGMMYAGGAFNGSPSQPGLDYTPTQTSSGFTEFTPTGLKG